MPQTLERYRVMPQEGEAEQAFLIRAENELKTLVADDRARAAVAVAQWTQRDRLRNAGEEYPKFVSMRHLEPGLVRYEYMDNPRGGKGATVLVNRAYLDKIRPTAIGKPIINGGHRDLPSNPLAKGEGDGVIINAYNSAEDGWDWVDALVWDEAAVNALKSGYQISCEHEIKNTGPGGIHNSLPYDFVALDGFYNHIAIVPRGRYEGVRILMMNSAEGGKTMKLCFEIESDKSTIEADGKTVPLSEAIKTFNEAEDKRKADEAARNAAPTALADTDPVQVGDKKVTVADLKAALLLKAKNESEEQMKKDHDDGKHKDKMADNCASCSKAKNEADAEEARKKKEKEDEEKSKAAKNAADLAAAVSRGHEPMPFPEPMSLHERAEKGREMFGSAKPAA